MSDSPCVSVILLSYNHCNFISKAINSVYLQDYPDIELIITDDASVDSSQERIKEILAEGEGIANIKTKTRFSRNNAGIVKNLNEGLKLASTNNIFILASDDHYIPSRIKMAMDLFGRYNVDVIACDGAVIDQNDQVISKSFYFPEGSGAKNDNSATSPVLIQNLPMYSAAGFVKGGFGLCFKKSILDPFGGLLPEDLTHEDDFISFLGLINKGVLFIPVPLVFYRRTGNNISGFTESENTEEIKRNFGITLGRQNTILREKIIYLNNNEIQNPYYNKNKQKLINSVSFREIRNKIVINYCNNESYLMRLRHIMLTLSLKQGLAVTIKYFLIGAIPFLTKRYVLSQNRILKSVFIN